MLQTVSDLKKLCAFNKSLKISRDIGISLTVPTGFITVLRPLESLVCLTSS